MYLLFNHFHRHVLCLGAVVVGSQQSFDGLWEERIMMVDRVSSLISGASE